MTSIIECITGGKPDLSLGNPAKPLQDILEAFFKIIPEIITLDFAVEVLKKPLPQVVFGLFVKNLSPDLPSFEVPGFGKFKGKNIDAKLFSIGTPTSGLLGLVTGLLTIQVGIPQIFIDFDLDGKPPIPKLKPPPTDLESVMSELVKSSLNLNLPETAVPKEFPAKLVGCIVKQITGILS